MFSEPNLHVYGTALPVLELDQVPSKKPLYVQDQIATDDQGRRRFHGAFTGGFSAGYWNTVGSKEGFTPQSFKSSRTEKTIQKFAQKPEDFMDDEDRGEFGIAPKSIKINEDFTSVTEQSEIRKRKFLQNDLQPIPGEPVLQQLVKPVKDKAAARILKTWGWRPGQGIGPRQTRKEKKKAKERNKKELYLMEKYGCEIPSTSKTTLNEDDEDDDDYTEDEEDEITFAPEDCELPPHYIKEDKYGLGYEPLSRQSVLGAPLSVKQIEHINLFQPLEAVGKNNQKISFSGQAFGVGALEEDDDEDVYAADDATRYDFSLEDKKRKSSKKKVDDLEELLFGEFMLDRNPAKPPVYKVEMPFGWHPRNWYEKRSRFEPLDPRKQRDLEQIFSSSSNKAEMTREKRAELLGEVLKKPQPSDANEKPKEIKTKTVEELQQEYRERKEKTKSLIEKITAKSSSFTKGGIISIEGEEKALSPESFSSSFKPFAMDEKKQKRYDQFLAKEFKNEQEIEEFLKTIQPVELSLWDRQMELKEFQQAKKLYKPLKGLMSDRFITESEVKAVENETKKVVEQNQIMAERSKQTWKPHSLLCKRYNIAEPFKGVAESDKKYTSKQKKLSVFDYLETSINKKEDFQTPVIIPRNIERPKQIIKQSSEAITTEAIKEKENEIVALEWQEVLNPSQKPAKERNTFSFKPKTALEKQVVESINKPVTEKKELFKAIFSDSESEDDCEDENNTKNEEIMPDISKPFCAAAANLLRNNSPPRGIFKALFATSVTATNNENGNVKQSSQTNETIKQSQTNENLIKDASLESGRTTKVLFKPKSTREPKEAAEVYGPALPQSLASLSKSSEKISLKSSVDEKILNLYNKHKSKLEVADKWIEKSTNIDSTDTEEDSLAGECSESSNSQKSMKQKKKSKKSKKKKLSDHKHKKHKDHKSSKKLKKQDKKKKKHKK